MALRTQINTILVLYSVLVCTVNNPWRLSYLIFTMEPFVLHHLAPDHLQRGSRRNADMCFVVKWCDMKGVEEEIWQRGSSLFPPSSFTLLILDLLQKERMTHLGRRHVRESSVWVLRACVRGNSCSEGRNIPTVWEECQLFRNTYASRSKLLSDTWHEIKKYFTL